MTHCLPQKCDESAALRVLMCDFQSSGASATTTTLTLTPSTPASACGTASSSSWGVYSMSAWWWNSSNGKNTQRQRRTSFVTQADAGTAGNRCNRPRWLVLTDNSRGVCLSFLLGKVIIDLSVYVRFISALLFSLRFIVLPGKNTTTLNKTKKNTVWIKHERWLWAFVDFHSSPDQRRKSSPCSSPLRLSVMRWKAQSKVSPFKVTAACFQMVARSLVQHRGAKTSQQSFVTGNVGLIGASWHVYISITGSLGEKQARHQTAGPLVSLTDTHTPRNANIMKASTLLRHQDWL